MAVASQIQPGQHSNTVLHDIASITARETTTYQKKGQFSGGNGPTPTAPSTNARVSMTTDVIQIIHVYRLGGFSNLKIQQRGVESSPEYWDVIKASYA